jgi:hypothetical protein
VLPSSIINGTSFGITSANASDSSTVYWLVVNGQ